MLYVHDIKLAHIDTFQATRKKTKPSSKHMHVLKASIT